MWDFSGEAMNIPASLISTPHQFLNSIIFSKLIAIPEF
jgi:hypothetical protein